MTEECLQLTDLPLLSNDSNDVTILNNVCDVMMLNDVTKDVVFDDVVSELDNNFIINTLKELRRDAETQLLSIQTDTGIASTAKPLSGGGKAHHSGEEPWKGCWDKVLGYGVLGRTITNILEEVRRKDMHMLLAKTPNLMSHLKNVLLLFPIFLCR